MAATRIMLFFVVLAIIQLTLTFANEVEKSNVHTPVDDRKPSVFKVGDEWLALPETFSVLDFAANSTFAADDDIDGQNRLRSSRYWGRIYLDGWPQTIQYFRAHFGLEPPIGRKKFVFAEPRDACSSLLNAGLLTSEHVLLVQRGSCTFGTKAKIAKETQASGIIIINNEPGLDHLPGPDAHDIQYSITSIPQPEGRLLEAVYDDVPNLDQVTKGQALGRAIEGYMVPINCDDIGSKCAPTTVMERQMIENIIDGGNVIIHKKTKDGYETSTDNTFEYVLGHFGVMMPEADAKYDLVMAKPAEACTPLENDVKGKVVLVRRGSCAFVKKAEEVMNAGGRVMILGSTNPYIVRMGVEPRWKGLNTAIPIAMVSKRTYSELVAEAYTGGQVSFQGSTAVKGSTWLALESLYNGEGWPRSESYIKKKFEELSVEYENWPDRKATLLEAYHKKVKPSAADGNADSNKHEEL